MEKFISKRSVVCELEFFYPAHEVPMMMAMRGVVAEDAPIVLLVNEVINKCEVISDDVPVRVLPCFLANFSGSMAAFDIHFSINDFFDSNTSQGVVPVSHSLILAQVCGWKSCLPINIRRYCRPSAIDPAMPHVSLSRAEINLVSPFSLLTELDKGSQRGCNWAAFLSQENTLFPAEIETQSASHSIFHMR